MSPKIQVCSQSDLNLLFQHISHDSTPSNPSIIMSTQLGHIEMHSHCQDFCSNSSHHRILKVYPIATLFIDAVRLYKEGQNLKTGHGQFYLGEGRKEGEEGFGISQRGFNDKKRSIGLYFSMDCKFLEESNFLAYYNSTNRASYERVLA